MTDDDSLAEKQNKEYEKLREEGKGKQEAAAEAAPPKTTEAHAEDAK